MVIHHSMEREVEFIIRRGRRRQVDNGLISFRYPIGPGGGVGVRGGRCFLYCLAGRQ
ncbi:hypothetical protein MOUN0_A00474 [Monosporozyma unispora]